MPTSLWLQSDEPRPGPRRAHTLDEIADACIRLVDAEGLPALSMRRVADTLGTSAAALYRYVSGKDDLLALIADRVAAEYDFAPLTGDVRTDVLAVAEQSRALYLRHPWMSRVQQTQLGPNAVRYLDQLVGALAPSSLDTTSTMMGVALISGWVTNFATQEGAGATVSDAGGGAEHLAAMLAHGDYPHLAALFAAAGGGASEPLDNDAAFVGGIDALLFGIAPGRK
ncbi:TetR/AcrR family transcriptional regulator [Rhodococcus coprophilus]|uniref:TetR family transcriptional regulator n=1 Tax=Rhodococcus coprophilus TaxID=38310 RepID=A0A2X4UE12_9NOCA|nr:TetR/AcrR family transcriptional regulator [Rhodococcus coprophilus]MBM7459681.1 AcrR family transcriptional regulator [Rhodococcus coprophilus]SQI37031.1 TetR family transcriptional regulator [Rhodococcus coprophilus]